MSSRFAIMKPCPKTWADLHGDGRQKHCDVCQKSVHAIGQYSQEEWDQIWHQSDGHVCGLVSGDSPPEPRSRRAVLVGALLTAISPLMAQSGRVRIRVTDATGAVVPNAEVSLLGSDEKATRTARTDAVGEVVLMDLPFGDCRFTVVAPGFQTRRLTATIRSGDEVQLQATLELGSIGEVVVVEAASVPIIGLQAPAEVSAPSSEPKPAKRRRWLIFR